MAKNEFQLDWHSKRAKRIIGMVLAGLLVLYVILPQLLGLNSFKQGALPHDWRDVYLAGGYFALTFVVSAVSIMFLAFKRLGFAKTLLVQFASVPLNMLLPAGIGNMGVNFMYLRHRHHTPMRAGMVVSANNLLGVAGNLSVLVVLFAVYGFNSSDIQLYWHYIYWIVIAGLILVILAFISLRLMRSHIEHIRNFKRQMLNALNNYNERPISFIGAYLCAIAQALLTALAFWYCLQAYGIRLSYQDAFLVFSLSVIVRTGVPTPGGLGGVEASLVAGIVATHASSLVVAVASVLAFRLITYWLPLVAGAAALYMVERTRLLSLN